MRLLMKQPFKFFSEKKYYATLFTLVLLISNHRILLCWMNGSCSYINNLADYIIWGLIALAAFLLLINSERVNEYVQSWKRNWLLCLFIFYSVISILWSIAPERSAHTVFIMLTSSITGGIFATIYSPKLILNMLLRFTVIVALFSLFMIIAFPDFGIHQDEVWQGAWRGVFDHKNDFGPIMALGNGLSLLSFLLSNERRRRSIDSVSYFLTLFLLFMSQCSSAVILWAVLNGLVFIYFAWMKWGSKLKNKGWKFIVSLVAVIVSLGLLLLISLIFLMGKSLNLTGRIPLWLTLLENVVSKKPWFGYGLETLWYFPEFQKWASGAAGWGEQIVVVNGHNGYIDILIYLGIVGLLLLILFLGQGLFQALQRAISGRSWLDLFPLLVLVYVLTANLTVDYMLEFENFHWIVLIVLLFLPAGKFSQES